MPSTTTILTLLAQLYQHSYPFLSTIAFLTLLAQLPTFLPFWINYRLSYPFGSTTTILTLLDHLPTTILIVFYLSCHHSYPFVSTIPLFLPIRLNYHHSYPSGSTTTILTLLAQLPPFLPFWLNYHHYTPFWLNYPHSYPFRSTTTLLTFLAQLSPYVLLQNVGFSNSCITERCLHNSRKVSLNDLKLVRAKSVCDAAIAESTVM